VILKETKCGRCGSSGNLRRRSLRGLISIPKLKIINLDLEFALLNSDWVLCLMVDIKTFETETRHLSGPLRSTYIPKSILKTVREFIILL
jgi:hypothetical protein